METLIQNPNLKIMDAGYRRIDSIDFVRGLAMVVMALDHTRDFICNIPFEPEDISKTWMFYFLVRWVTHFLRASVFSPSGGGGVPLRAEAFAGGADEVPGDARHLAGGA